MVQLLLVAPSRPLVMLTLPTSCSALPSARACSPAVVMMAGGKRTDPVGHLIQSELAMVIRNVHNVGTQRIPSGLQQMISVVDVDMSPDLRNARVKVSIIGERKDKISAVRWLRSNVRGIRHELAKRNRGMKRIPMLSFSHVDVGAATDIMVQLEELRVQDEAAARSRGDGIDFEATDDEAWEDEDEDEDAWLEADEDDDDDLEEEWTSLE